MSAPPTTIMIYIYLNYIITNPSLAIIYLCYLSNVHLVVTHYFLTTIDNKKMPNTWSSIPTTRSGCQRSCKGNWKLDLVKSSRRS